MYNVCYKKNPQKTKTKKSLKTDTYTQIPNIPPPQKKHHHIKRWMRQNSVRWEGERKEKGQRTEVRLFGAFVQRAADSTTAAVLSWQESSENVSSVHSGVVKLWGTELNKLCPQKNKPKYSPGTLQEWEGVTCPFWGLKYCCQLPTPATVSSQGRRWWALPSHHSS